MAKAKVLPGVKPRLMVTNPPHGVNYDRSWRVGVESDGAATGEVLNDNRPDWHHRLGSAASRRRLCLAIGAGRPANFKLRLRQARRGSHTRDRGYRLGHIMRDNLEAARALASYLLDAAPHA